MTSQTLTTAGAYVDAKTDPYGNRRFYPPGRHPAIHRQQVMLAKLKELRDRTNPALLTGAIFDAIAYHERQIENFEVGELKAKRIEYERALDRLGRESCS